MDIDKVKSMLKQAKNAMLKYNATLKIDIEQEHSI